MKKGNNNKQDSGFFDSSNPFIESNPFVTNNNATPTTTTTTSSFTFEDTSLVMSNAKLNEEQIEEFKESFNLYDKNKDGKIDAAELGAVMRTLGTILPNQEILDTIRDFGNAGLLTLDGFLQWMSRKFTDDFQAEDIIEAFQVFDKDGKGLISASELRHVLTFLGDRLDESQVEEMLMQAVGSGDGSVAYEPFVRKMLEK